MNKRMLIGGFGVALLLAATVVWWITKDRGADAAPIFYGNIDIRDVNLGFRVSGRLAKVAVDEGEAVNAGDVLAELDPEPALREVHEGEANLGALSARALLLKAGYRPEEVAQARASVEEKRATLRNADEVLARQLELSGTGASSRRAFDEATAQRAEAQARLRSAEAALRQFESGYRKQEIGEAQANLDKAEASLAQSRLRLQDSVLRAPASGIILTRATEPGAILAAGTTVFTLSLTKPVWARVYVNEKELGRVVPGTHLLVYTDSNPDRPYSGRVGYVSPTAEFTPKSVETQDLRTDLVYRVRVLVDDPDTGLRQGMPVTVKFPVQGAASSAQAASAASAR